MEEMRDEDPRGWSERLLFGMSWIVWVPLIALVILLSARVFAHDHSRPELTPWFKSLHSKVGSPCCDGSDATSLDDPDWESKDGHYRVKLDGEWVDVPDNAVVEGPNRAGPAMVWPYYLNGGLRGVRCFIPGTMT